MSVLSRIAAIQFNPRVRRALGGPAVLVLCLLVIEFLDELIFGVREAAWPLIRTDLGLSYAQIGLLLALPGLVSSLIEPVLGILGDLGRRRLIIVTGGLLYAATLMLAGLSPNFGWFLASFALMYPASGALVGLGEASLMDVDPSRHEHLMARWTLAGSVGVVAGPLALGLAAVAGLGWRGALMVMAAGLLAVTGWVWRQPELRRAGAAAKPQTNGEGAAQPSGRAALKAALVAAHQPRVLYWLVLLQAADLMLDVLVGFLALYFVDVVGTSPALAGTAVAIWSGAGLLGDALIIPVLERVRGLTYLRYSAVAKLVLYPAFLLAPWLEAKLVLLALIGLANAGWYAILQGHFYSALPGRSGTAMAAGSALGLVTWVIPAGLGAIAQAAGLTVTMWLLLAGPIVLLVGLLFAKK